MNQTPEISSLFGAPQIKCPHTCLDENLLGEFPSQLRRAMVLEMVGFLINDSASGSLFPTPAHLKMAMEIIGHGFALPLEEER